MAEEPQPMTLQQRIAALNTAQVGRQTGETHNVSLRPRPDFPVKLPVTRQKSFNIPNENNIATTAQPVKANLPNGPPPLPSRKLPPPLPARKSTQEEVRPDGAPYAAKLDRNEVRLTATRTKSEENGSRIKAPAWGVAELPPLPTRVETKTQTKSHNQRPEPATRTPSVSSIASSATSISISSRPGQPPPLPSRKSTDSVSSGLTRKVPPLPTNDMLERVRKASFASNTDVSERNDEPVPPLPLRRPSAISVDGAIQSIKPLKSISSPPPVPTFSRPDLAAIQATKPKANNQAIHPTSPPSTGCLTCRDFSAPDQHATLFPRQHVRSLQELAHQLTAPFPSITDKARAIFTWLHHNVDYNVRDFFSGNVKSSTPQSTLQTGLAVCEGYAALFTNLATYAGLESRVISGHGKGFGYQHLAPGSALPPYSAGHAWNVVRIDNGEWKLIDCCWGAGYCNGNGLPYVRKFSPERFTQSNEEFGIDHFPGSRGDFFLPGGQQMTWEEYIQINPATWPYPFERPTIFGNAESDFTIGKQTMTPVNRQISVRQQGTVRFQFGLFCPHWTLDHHTRKGPPPVFILAAGGLDGRNKHYVPLEHVQPPAANHGGDLWYIDVPAQELGAPGETLTLFAVNTFGDRQNARGLTVKEFQAGVGRTAMSFVGVAAWELV